MFCVFKTEKGQVEKFVVFVPNFCHLSPNIFFSRIYLPFIHLVTFCLLKLIFHWLWIQNIVGGGTCICGYIIINATHIGWCGNNGRRGEIHSICLKWKYNFIDTYKNIHILETVIPLLGISPKDIILKEEKKRTVKEKVWDHQYLFRKN